MKTSPLRAIGLMSGTSMDGVDVALIESNGNTIARFGPTGFRAYSESERAVLRAALAEAPAMRSREDRPPVLAAAELLVTMAHGEAVEAFLRDHALDPASVDIVGFHGQTVFHRPKAGLTVQLGDGASLARRLGIDIAYDFRAADVAAGGEGAPLVPVFHRALVESAGLPRPVVVANIGGVSNITYIDGAGDPIACDTGPGNALLDDFMLERIGVPLDRDGAAAAEGVVHNEALTTLLSHPFFREKPPKSLDRNAFSRGAVARLSTADGAATLTHFTARAIAEIVALLPRAPALWVIAGGGAANPALMRALSAALPGEVIAAEALGWSSGHLEAQAFGFLAVRTRLRLPLTFPSTTGVKEPMTGGVIAKTVPDDDTRDRD